MLKSSSHSSVSSTAASNGFQNELGDLFHLAGGDLFTVGCAKPATAIVASGDVVLLAAESGNQSARRV